MAHLRTSPRHCSVIFSVEYVNGVPYIQHCHLRELGYSKDIRINDDIGVADLTLKDVYDLLEASDEVGYRKD